MTIDREPEVATEPPQLAKLAREAYFQAGRHGHPGFDKLYPASMATWERVASAVTTAAVGPYIAIIAECRDAFPVPQAGGPLCDAWTGAMADPDGVPAYLRAVASEIDALRTDAPRFRWLMANRVHMTRPDRDGPGCPHPSMHADGWNERPAGKPSARIGEAIDEAMAADQAARGAA